jgi:ABC-type multidrug transport system fused ATPase/permease subunit
MSVAKPTVEYVNRISVRRGISGTLPLFKEVMRYYRPYLHFVVLIIILSAARAYFFTLEPFYTGQIIDTVIGQGQYDLLLGFALSTIWSVAGYAVTNFLIMLVQGFVSQFVMRDLRQDYYSAAQNKSFNFLDTSAVGDLVSRATAETRELDMFLRVWIGQIADGIFTVVFMLNVMYAVNPFMTLLAFIPILIVFYVANRQSRLSRPIVKKMQLILGKLGGYVQQNIIGMKVVRIFQREKEMEEGFDQVEDIYVNNSIVVAKIWSEYQTAPENIMTLGIAAFYVYGANLVTASLLTIGELVMFTRYMGRTSMPLRTMSTLQGSWASAATGLERMDEIKKTSVDVKDRTDAKDLTISAGEVDFEEVSFGYSKDRPVVKNLNFKVAPGEKIAILGATGSGKTSLIYLIPRFYDVNSGRILIDGTDVRDYKLTSLRMQVGLVLQDVFLFTGTIRDNIAFGKPEATMDEVIAAAKLARIHDFIETLPEEYESLVGERGVTLSGGQKQRITIARTIITNPKILILDDSLSFVDAKTEQQIQEALEEAMKGRTTFMIAQRLSTIKNADRILVLDKGEIVELGTHDELMANGGVYKRIYETQFLEKAPEVMESSEVR